MCLFFKKVGVLLLCFEEKDVPLCKINESWEMALLAGLTHGGKEAIVPYENPDLKCTIKVVSLRPPKPLTALYDRK